MQGLRRVAIVGMAALSTCAVGLAQTAPLPRLHVLAVGVDAAGSAQSSPLPTQLGIDTKQFASTLRDANVVDIHLLVNDETIPANTLVEGPVDLELDKLQKTVAPQDTLLVEIGARLYPSARSQELYVDLDKYGIDFPVAHLLVLLREMPCANVVLVLPGVMDTASEVNLHRYVDNFPKGSGAANLDLITSTTLVQEGGLHAAMLGALARGLRGDADLDHDETITSAELNRYMLDAGTASQPTALQRLDPYYRAAVHPVWSAKTSLSGAAFMVLSRPAQAQLAGAPMEPARSAPGTTRGPTVVQAEAPAPIAVSLPKTYALLFATNQYDNWKPLSNPVPDARALQALLRDTYGAQTELVPDATADEVLKTLVRYIGMHFDDDAQVIVFFGGHGYYAEDVGAGYLATRESKLPSADPARRSMLSHDDIRRYVGKISAKHILLLMDTCYSSTFDRRISDAATRDDASNPMYAPRPLAQVISLQTKYPTRRVITSGSRDVPDGVPGQHSPFTRALLQTLTKDADEHGYARLRDIASGLEPVQPTPHWASMDEQDDLNGDIILLTPAMRAKLLASGGASGGASR